MKFITIIFILCALSAFVVIMPLSAVADDVLIIDNTASLTLDNLTAITVTGTITGTGTLACTASTSPAIYISGNWGIATFSPANSTVYFDETTVITSTTNNKTFYNLNISGSVSLATTSSNGLDITNALTLSQYASLDLGTGLTHTIQGNTTISGTLNLGLSNLMPNGNLTIPSIAILNMNGISSTAHPQLTMANGTSLQVDGTLNTNWSLSNSKPVITSTGTGAYSFIVNGKIDANGLIIAGTTNGLTINAAANQTSDLDNVEFLNTANGGRHLYIGFTNGNYVGNYDGCSFDQSFGVGVGNNVVCVNTSGSTTLYFTNWQSGNGGGNQYESEGTNTSIIWIDLDTMVATGTASIELASTAAITVPGDFNIAILTCTGSANIYVAGAWNVTTFTPGSSTVWFNGGTQSIIPSGIFYNMVVQSSAGYTPSGTEVSGPSGSLTVAPQNANIAANYELDGVRLILSHNTSLQVESNAKFKAYNNASITTPTPGTDRFSFIVNGEIDLDNCSITSMSINGLDIKSSATIDAINNVRFYNHPGGSGRFMTITTPNLNMGFQGCWFDTISSGYNVSATSSSSVLRFDTYNAGDYAGEGYDNDDDNTPQDEVADFIGGTVVTWIYRTITSTESYGGIQGFPTPAFDLNGGGYYSTYVASRDILGSGTIDRLYVLDENGNIKYYYEVLQKYGDIVFGPWYYTEGTTHTVYFGTTTGYIFRLIDSGTSLTLSPGWPIKACTEITSGVITDGINLYFGGMDGTLPKIFAYIISNGSQLFALPPGGAPSRISATPSWAISGTDTYLFIGSDYQQLTSGIDGRTYNNQPILTSDTANFITNGIDVNDVVAFTSGSQQGRYRVILVDSETQVTLNATFSNESIITFSAGQTPLLYRVNVTASVIDKQSNSALDHIRAPTVYWEWLGTKLLFAGDYYGGMQGVDPITMNNLPVTWPAQSIFTYNPYSITAMAAVIYTPVIRILYADTGGWFYDRNQNGSLYVPAGGSYPFQPGGNTPIESAPLAPPSGLIYIGNNDGKVFVINEDQRAVTKTYSFGSGMKIGDISRDADNLMLLVPTSTGKIFYLTE